MKAGKCIGICMDHINANLMEFTTDPIVTTTLVTQFTHQAKEDTVRKSEVLMHHKEQHEQNDYYKHLGAVIKGYDHVVLFGPTEAKVELANLLKSDRHFDHILIEVVNADKMTEPQQHAFVKEHFTNHRKPEVETNY
jgi:hypothetical protein